MLHSLQHIPRRNKFMQKQPDEMVGSVTAWDILTASERQYGIRLHESHLLMEGPITAFGTFKVPLNLRTKEDRCDGLTGECKTPLQQVCLRQTWWIGPEEDLTATNLTATDLTQI